MEVVVYDSDPGWIEAKEIVKVSKETAGGLDLADKGGDMLVKSDGEVVA